MSVFRWPLGRIARGNAIFALLALNVAFIVIDWMAFRRLDLMIDFGFRFVALSRFDSVPVWRVAVEVAADVAIALIAIARLHDASYSARWLGVVFGLNALSLLPWASGLSLVALLGWIAIAFLPPTIGPNRFGADPRGWTSREHFDEQQRRLAGQQDR